MFTISKFSTTLNNLGAYKFIRNYTTQMASEQFIFGATRKKTKKVLNVNTINENIVKMKWAAKGSIAPRVIQLSNELKQGVKKPFKDIILTHIGSPQAMGQRPITFLRQLVMLALYPPLMDNPRFPIDAKQRVKLILNDCLGQSLGSYTHLQGIEVVRKHIANFIYLRDGGLKEVNKDDIFISEGASSLVRMFLKIFSKEIGGKPTGYLVPVPQYPLYSVTDGMYKIQYYLDEDHNWGINFNELKKLLEDVRQFCTPRLMILVNPGNPTGQVLSRKCLEDTVKFAFNEQLFLIADEVYQDNVYGENTEFHSLRKVMLELGPPYSRMELVSLHSCSKGFAGECGFRSGYAELFNIDEEVRNELIKLVSLVHCPNSSGQVILDGMVYPPAENGPSYELFIEEKCCVLNGLSEKAENIVNMLNGIEGIQCCKVQGAMYAFPKISLPEKFVEEARKSDIEPDELFCLRLLDEKGIGVFPGSTFGQKPGTYHFRTTILPLMETMKFMIREVKDFMKQINEKTGRTPRLSGPVV